MAEKIQLLQTTSSFANLGNCHILVDTNFLIDAKNYPNVFDNIIESLRNQSCTLVGITAVLFEFTKGAKSKEEYKKKVEYYRSIINTTLPLTPDIHDNISNLNRVLMKKSLHLSYADGLLLAMLMKYPTLKLLSKDRSDIPTTFFPVFMSLLLETNDNNCSFNIYSFDKRAYTDKLVELTS